METKLETTFSNIEQSPVETPKSDDYERVPEARGRDVNTLPLSYFYSAYFLGQVTLASDHTYSCD